jgi:environmental stress-induced protein Ves
MRKLSHADYLEMPWKNGGGVTTQLAIYPVDAGLDSFSWRISMARVTQSGPFSLFPGIDRSLAVVEGAGLKLSMPGRSVLQIDESSASCAFPGDWNIDSTLVDGAVIDFNVLTRRDAWTHKLERLRLDGKVALEGADDVFIYCVQGEAYAGDITVAAGEALQTGPCAMLDLCTNAPSLLYLVRLYRKNQKGTVHA